MKNKLILAGIFATVNYLVDAAFYETEVVILGGGVSGISAALSLAKSGIKDFIIVEARHELGGRAQDVPFANINVEFGCNWIHGLGTNPIYRLAQKHGLRTVHSDNDDVVFYNESGKVDLKDRYSEFKRNYEDLGDLAETRLLTDQVDISARTGLGLVGWIPQTSNDNAIEYYGWDNEIGESPDLSSSIFATSNEKKAFQTFDLDENNSFVIDERGYKHIFIEEIRPILDSCETARLLVNTTVTEVKYNDDGVKVYTKNGNVIYAKYAISTFSVGVLQHQDVIWSPPLPDWKMEGIFGFHMGTYTKIFMSFPEKFWDDEQFVIWADSNRGYLNTWQNLNKEGYLPSDSAPYIFFVTVTQDIAHKFEAYKDQREAVEEIMVVLRKMYGPGIPEPIEIKYPRWHSDPLFRGSFSNWPIGELDQHHANMRAPLNNRLFFAGEAMSPDYFGFLQGAWFSGLEVGYNVVSCIKTECPYAPYYQSIGKATAVAENDPRYSVRRILKDKCIHRRGLHNRKFNHEY